MSIKPILFNTEMVQAILEWSKTVTRRVVKMDRPSIYKAACSAGRWSETFGNEVPDEVAEWYAGEAVNPPYHPGDILWVWETWHKDAGRYMYKADYADAEQFFCGDKEVNIRWSNSIHMPREAARLFLRVTAVRVERLQNISSFDVLSEGVFDGECNRCREEAGGCYPQKSEDVFCGREDILADKYADLWDSTIKPADLPRYGWDANPFVWAVEFERCERPENFLKEGTDHEQ